MVVMRTIEDKIARGKAHTAAKAEVRGVWCARKPGISAQPSN